MTSSRRIFHSFYFWVLFAGLAVYLLMPLRERLRFGIDLVGGTYITLEVQVDKAIESELMERMQSFATKFKAANQPLPVSQSVDKATRDIQLKFDSDSIARNAADLIKRQEKDLVVAVEGAVVKLKFTDAKAHQIKDVAVKSNIEVLRTRLDKFSVAEISIAQQGEKHIIVELPDVADPQQAKAMIGKAAILEFKLVEKMANSEEELRAEYDGELPEGMEIIPGRPGADGYGKSFYLVPTYTDITGKGLRDARPDLGGQTGAEMVINFRLSPEVGDRFYELTSKNYGRQLAAILDGEVIVAPRINSAIRSEGLITGRFTSDEANELALLLKSGAFVAPVTFEEERQIGPSLGAESIRQGLISCLVGLALLVLFSIFFYKIPGFLAFIALLYNLLLTLLALSWFKATLTLPGIAGMVLTVGMAIDASILIYERVREALAAGITLRKAVSDGFSDAMVVILDANITTLIVGIVLYKFGTGPIQGFAVTISLGILTTLITGLFFLRSILNFVIDAFNVQKMRF
jgi:preprotein translocase subunit SecD